MTDLTQKFTRFAAAALIAVVPAAGMASSETGSPAQSVINDPDEDVSMKKVTGESMHDTPKADQGDEAYEDADVVEDTDGSLIEDDAKRDG